jgi:hypothetical protein
MQGNEMNPAAMPCLHTCAGCAQRVLPACVAVDALHHHSGSTHVALNELNRQQGLNGAVLIILLETQEGSRSVLRISVCLAVLLSVHV